MNVEELIDLAKLIFVNRERIVENSCLRKKKDCKHKRRQWTLKERSTSMVMKLRQKKFWVINGRHVLYLYMWLERVNH